MSHPWFPPFDLVLRTPRLELRALHGEAVRDAIELTDAGIHHPAEMPFSIAWTDDPMPQRHWESVRHWFRVWADCRPERWTLSFASYHDGRMAGVQDLIATDFPIRRTVESGSWVGRGYQRQGFGFEQRVAVLALAFDGLEAEVAETAAWHDNTASAGVTSKIGYEPNGEAVMARRGVADRMLRFRLTRERWLALRVGLPAVDLTGVEAVRPFLGLEP